MNRLILGDCKDIMPTLPKVDLIYIDPPFGINRDKDFGMLSWKNNHQEKNRIDELFGAFKLRECDLNYLRFMWDRLTLMHDLLSDIGSIYVHCDYRVNSYLRLILDEIFGKENFRNEIVWGYRTGGASKEFSLSRKHDSIFLYSKCNLFKINTKMERQYLEKKFMDSKVDKEGRFYVDTILRDIIEGLVISPDSNGNIIKYNTRPVLNLSSERLSYPTQKPEGLVELLLEVSSNEGDLVADFFCGSGTTLAVAEKLGRKWIGVDISERAIETCKRRAENMQWDCKIT